MTRRSLRLCMMTRTTTIRLKMKMTRTMMLLLNQGLLLCLVILKGRTKERRAQLISSRWSQLKSGCRRCLKAMRVVLHPPPHYILQSHSILSLTPLWRRGPPRWLQTMGLSILSRLLAPAARGRRTFGTAQESLIKAFSGTTSVQNAPAFSASWRTTPTT